MRHRSLPPACGLFLALLTAACATGRRSAHERAHVPFVFDHGLVFVEVEVPGHGKQLALLDTGANASAVDPEWTRDLAVEELVDVVGTTGTLPAELVRVEGVRLGGLALEPLRATRRDLRGLLAPAGRHVGMILGSDALVDRALTLDFTTCRLELTPSPRGAGDGGVAMIADHGVPAIEAELGDQRLWLRIDTGASLFETDQVFVNLPAPVWDAVHARTPTARQTTKLLGTGADGSSVELPVFEIPATHVGPLRVESVSVIVQPAIGYFARPDAKGFVSNNLLRKLGRVTLDFAAGRLVVGR